jgi:hypothetical protein
MDIEDEYYNKYIKYKTKYLELKQSNQSGGWNFSFIFPKEKPYGINYNFFLTEYKKLEEKKITKPDELIFWTEKLLFEYILPKLYDFFENKKDEDNKNNIINVYNVFCYTKKIYIDYNNNVNKTSKEIIIQNNNNNKDEIINYLDKTFTSQNVNNSNNKNNTDKNNFENQLKAIINSYYINLNEYITDDKKHKFIYDTCNYNAEKKTDLSRLDLMFVWSVKSYNKHNIDPRFTIPVNK